MAAVKPWLVAFRLRTLPLALSSIGMGSVLAAWQGAHHWEITGLAALTTILLQVLSNLANDYGDSVHGIDSAEREGPSRMVQSGAISMAAMKKALYLFAFLSLASGLLLLWVAFADDLKLFFTFLALGVLAIVAAVTYTAGKKPYGYIGLGDLSVFLFFGLLAVLGTFFLHTAQLNWWVLLPAASCGFFATAVLNVNNIRDISSDTKAGKRSIPVMLGRKNAVLYHWVLLISGLASAAAFILIAGTPVTAWAFLLALPLLLLNGIKVSQKQKATELDPYLRQMVLSTLVFVLTFSIGLLW